MAKSTLMSLNKVGVCPASLFPRRWLCRSDLMVSTSVGRRRKRFKPSAREKYQQLPCYSTWYKLFLCTIYIHVSRLQKQRTLSYDKRSTTEKPRKPLHSWKMTKRSATLTLPLTTSSLTDDFDGRASREAAVNTRLMWTNSSRVTNLPWTTCWNSSERIKSSCKWWDVVPPCIGETGGDGNAADDKEDLNDVEVLEPLNLKSP